jgi:serine/threonine protein kinase
MTLRTGDRLGPYEIVAPLGAGGMGEVYRARDTRLGRDVAIKVLPAEFASDPDRLRRFEQEARATGQLNHPNILTVFDIGTHEGAPYIVTELLEGETLQERLRPGGLPVRKAVEIAIEIARGLAAAHDKGIIHRDLKPANLFVTRDGHVKILDFGIAKLAAPRSAHESAETAPVPGATEAGTTLGTVGYISPEQLRGQPVDHRTDVFSFGCVLHEMLSGRRVFEGGTTADTIAAVLGKDPAPLGVGVPSALQGIVRRCLEKVPEDRFSSAQDITLGLNVVTEALLTPEVPSEPPEKSIVVLPFENLSPDPENAFFADGLTEELIADLSKVRALRVISRTSAMLLKGSKKDVPTIARELNVRCVLEGSVRRAGNSLRITAQLIDAASDAHLWAEKYGGTLDDVFAIQEKVSASIVESLKLTLTGDEKQRLAARMIPNVRAFDLYLQARQESYRLSESALDNAIQFARQALDIVGPNALLFSLLAEIEFFYHDQGIRPDEETLRRAESWVSKALDLDPGSAAGLRARGLIRARKGDMRSAIRDLRRAEELQRSGDTPGYLTWMLSEVGRMDEARLSAAEAVARDPLLWLARWGYAWVALLDGDFETALTRMRDAAEVGGGEPIQIFFLGICSAYAGRLDEACDHFGRTVDTGAPAISTMSAALRALYRRDIDTARKLLGSQTLIDLARLDKEFSWWLASAFSFAGYADETLHWLANAIDLGFVNHRFFSKIDPYLARLRGDPRFKALMERARERQRAFEI